MESRFRPMGLRLKSCGGLATAGFHGFGMTLVVSRPEIAQPTSHGIIFRADARPLPKSSPVPVHSTCGIDVSQIPVVTRKEK